MLAFGILVLPGFSIFAVFALMALVLVVRPAGPARPAAETMNAMPCSAVCPGPRWCFLAAACVPWLGSRFYTFLATDIAILALFAASLNLLLGYTGLVSFGHAAYFGVGAYTCAILMKTHGVSFALASRRGGRHRRRSARSCSALFCVRSTRIYFSMLTLAFAQIVWAICFKWNSVTGGEQGLSNVPYPEPRLDGGDSGVRRTAHERSLSICWCSCWSASLSRSCGGSSSSPFGRILTAIRENPERAEFVGINVRRYQLAAFVVAGAFAGWAGALFGIFNRGVFPDFAYWSKSAEVLIMVILGGMGHFWGPAVGAATLILLNQQITCLHAILAAHPRLDPDRAAVRVSRRHLRRAARRPRCGCGGSAMLEVRDIRKSFNGFTAVGGVSLDVPAQGITAVIGPNGAGKSTLFNLLTGHLRADAGSVAFEGRDITGAAPHAICRMGVGRSFQHTNIFRKLTVFENVQAALIAHRRPGAQFLGPQRGALSRRGARRSWTRSGLPARPIRSATRSRTATRSSSSSASRLPAIRSCCCWTSRPPACPPPRRARRSGCSSASSAERKLTLLFTEHDMDVVFSIAQKIAVLHQGRLIAEGTPADVRSDAEVRRVYLGGPAMTPPRGP